MILPLIGYATLALACLGVVLWVVGAFNDLVRLRSQVRREFANIEVSLKQRHDEIPRLVEVCRGYMHHEAQVLEKVTELRSRYARASDTNTKVLVENQIHLALGVLPAVFEAYPSLKANQQFRQLQARLGQIETTIADRRELFNQATTYYNSTLGHFPQLILARLLRFESGALFELADRVEAEAPEVDLSAVR